MSIKLIILLTSTLVTLNSYSQNENPLQKPSRSFSFFSGDQMDLVSIYYNVSGGIDYTAQIYGGIRGQAEVEHLVSHHQMALQFRRLYKLKDGIYHGFTLGYNSVSVRESSLKLSDYQYSFFDGGIRHELFSGVSIFTSQYSYYTSIDLFLSLYSSSQSQSPALQSSLLGLSSKVQMGYFLSTDWTLDIAITYGYILLKNFEVNNLRYEVTSAATNLFSIGMTFKLPAKN